jgi:type IV pilus assembly protein PilQ
VVSDKVATTAGTVTMRIEDRTPREAIDVIVSAKGLVMDELNGVFYVKTQEERSKEPTDSASFTLNYAQAKDILPLLQIQLSSGLVPQFDARTNTIFYREAKSNMEQIALFLETIDKPTKQVMIEARLVEVNANPKQSFGINWAGVLGGSTNPQTFRYGGSTGIKEGDPLNAVGFDKNNGRLKANDFFLNGQTTGGFADALAGQFAILSIPQLSATLRLLNEDSDTEFLANPRVVTANNTKAEIKIVRNQPVPQLNFNEQTAQAVFSGFQDKEFGNTLTVTPSINKDGFVSLQVKPDISNKVGDATFTFSGSTVTSPIIDRRTLDSNVLIKSGDTLAIGGLLQDEQTKSTNKVPILGDIPLLGYLFQEKLNARVKRNLLIFVTPTIIKQGYGTGLEGQVSGLTHSGEEFADPNGWRNNAKGAVRIVPTSNRSIAADVPKPGIAKAPRKVGYKVNASTRE